MNNAIVQKSAMTLILLTLAVCLVWYAVLTNRIASADLEFALDHPSARLFPQVRFWEGNREYYMSLNPASAAEHYRQAISRNPLLIDAWIALAKAELTQGRREEAQRILNTVTPLIAHVSTWKWQELLLAYDLEDTGHFAAALNFILSRLPSRIAEAAYLAQDLWGGRSAVIPHLSAENHPAYLNELIKAKDADAALNLWKIMEASDPPPEDTLKLRLCNFLMRNERIPEAKQIWKSWNGGVSSIVHDGGFELEPLNSAFGWRFRRHPEVTVERTWEYAFEESHCLNLRFRGTENVNFVHVFQIVPVQPGRSYTLHFARKSRSITTDQGVFVEAYGYRCRGLYASSEPVTGTSPWIIEELQIPVPGDCEAIVIRARRRESLKFDNKISGEYWLDDVKLEASP